MVQPPDFGDSDDLPCVTALTRTRLRRVLREREMRPRPVVVRHVAPDDPKQLPLVEREDVIEALPAE
jgi:hypothetical protein